MSLSIGKYNQVKILRSSPHGVYVGNTKEDEVLLPQKFVPKNAQEGDEIEVFVYTDSEDRPVAVTTAPKAIVGEFAALEVVDITKFGYFLDWGLEKDLFVPKAELPNEPVNRNEYMFVKVALDHQTNRVFGLGKLGAFIEQEDIDLKEGQEVEVLVGEETDIGFRCIVEDSYWGIIYHNEIFGEVVGQGKRRKAFVSKIREDGRVDIRLRKDGFEGVSEQSQAILDKLDENEGFLPVSDKSSPEEIQRYFSMSKKTFKKLIGNLYKQRKIQIQKDGIRSIK